MPEEKKQAAAKAKEAPGKQPVRRRRKPSKSRRQDASPGEPVDEMAGESRELEHQRRIVSRSIAPGGWTRRSTHAEWKADLLWPSANVLSGDKSSRPFTSGEKLDARWSPRDYQAKSFKPIPREELSPCAPPTPRCEPSRGSLIASRRF